MKIFYIFMTVFLLVFSGCSGASEENDVNNNYNGVYNDNSYDSSDTNIYDLATYNYNYNTKELGKTVTEIISVYDSYGNRTDVEVMFEKNKNSDTIYQYHDNRINSSDHIYDDEILTVDGIEQNYIDRHISTGQVFARASKNGVDISCMLVEHLGYLNTRDFVNIDIDNFEYIDALHIRCISTNGVTTDSYFVNGWGKVLSVINDNGVISYEVLDKNSMQVR